MIRPSLDKLMRQQTDSAKYDQRYSCKVYELFAANRRDGKLLLCMITISNYRRGVKEREQMCVCTKQGVGH